MEFKHCALKVLVSGITHEWWPGFCHGKNRNGGNLKLHYVLRAKRSKKSKTSIAERINRHAVREIGNSDKIFQKQNRTTKICVTKNMFLCKAKIALCDAKKFVYIYIEHAKKIFVYAKKYWLVISGEASPIFGHANAYFFCVYRPYKESISKEMNNDNALNLHLHDQMMGLASVLLGMYVI